MCEKETRAMYQIIARHEESDTQLLVLLVEYSKLNIVCQAELPPENLFASSPLTA